MRPCFSSQAKGSSAKPPPSSPTSVSPACQARSARVASACRARPSASRVPRRRLKPPGRRAKRALSGGSRRKRSRPRPRTAMRALRMRSASASASAPRGDTRWPGASPSSLWSRRASSRSAASSRSGIAPPSGTRRPASTRARGGSPYTSVGSTASASSWASTSSRMRGGTLIVSGSRCVAISSGMRRPRSGSTAVTSSTAPLDGS